MAYRLLADENIERATVTYLRQLGDETSGRHERHTPDGVEAIEFPGMVALRQRFITEVEAQQ